MRIGLGIGLDFTKKRGVLIAPVATAATSVTGTSFVANWNAYDGATTYYLDVSTSPTFATFVLQNQSVSAPATSYTVTGLTACTYYYYRVRAEGNKPTISIAPTLSPSGTQLTGTVITCGTGTWNSQGSIFNYKWKRNGVAITGATSNTYTIQAIDDGTTITCDVQNQNGFGKSAYVGTSNSVSATSFIGILDTYPNAQIAYSVRRLATAYTGPLLRVRRSSDNAEQDIGFNGSNNLDETALTTFCGAGNGFVTTWYDQSGNINNATQSTAANQPQIVSSGSMILGNLKPTISFLSGLSGLNFNTFTASSVNMFMIVKAKNDPPTDINSGFVKFGTQAGSNVVNHFPYSDSNIYDDTFSTTRRMVGNPTTPLNQLNIYNVLSTSTEWTAYLNINQIFTTGTNTVGINASPKIGSKDIAYGMNNFISEIIIYPSNQSSNRTGISTNINTYYGIF